MQAHHLTQPPGLAPRQSISQQPLFSLIPIRLLGYSTLSAPGMFIRACLTPPMPYWKNVWQPWIWGLALLLQPAVRQPCIWPSLHCWARAITSWHRVRCMAAHTTCSNTPCQDLESLQALSTQEIRRHLPGRSQTRLGCVLVKCWEIPDWKS